jgi:hypothetical protein
MKALALALAAFVVPVAADAAARHHRPHHHLSQAARGSYAQPRIACTQVGCLPVPRGCYPRGGRTFSGAPSGFDVMVCPSGTMYGHL